MPANYRVLFLQGGASLQFAMVPMNLLTQDDTADYLVTGVWATKAAEEAKKIGKVHIAATTKAEQFTRVPRAEEIVLTPGAAYVHMTSNNTIYGTEWKMPARRRRRAARQRYLVGHVQPPDRCRQARAHLRRGAEEHGTGRGHRRASIREDLLARSPASLPAMLSYAVHAENGSLYNTPPVFAIYLLGLVMRGSSSRAGLEAMAAQNERKAAKLYAEIDRTGFYRGTAQKDSRSLMNVTFRLAERGAGEAVRQGSGGRPASTA